MLSDNECEEVERQGIWRRDQQVNVEKSNIEHLKSVLQALQQRIWMQPGRKTQDFLIDRRNE